MSEAKHTPLPWTYEPRTLRNEPSPFSWYIRGDIHESFDDEDSDSYDEDGELVSTAVAVVEGNPTAGDIPRLNAELIVRSVNSHADLLAACEAIQAALSKYGAQLSELFGHDEQFNAAVEAVDAAIAKAKGLTPDL